MRLRRSGHRHCTLRSWGADQELQVMSGLGKLACASRRILLPSLAFMSKVSDCSSPRDPSICYVNWPCLLLGGWGVVCDWASTGHPLAIHWPWPTRRAYVLFALPDKSLIQLLYVTLITTRMSYFMLCPQAWRPTGFNSTDRSPLATSSSVLLPVSLRWAAAPL